MCLAIPGKVLSITGDDPVTRMGKIDFSGIIKQASLAYVPEVQVGDYVIVTSASRSARWTRRRRKRYLNI